jgi:hypothetical protein
LEVVVLNRDRFSTIASSWSGSFHQDEKCRLLQNVKQQISRLQLIIIESRGIISFVFGVLTFHKSLDLFPNPVDCVHVDHEQLLSDAEMKEAKLDPVTCQQNRMGIFARGGEGNVWCGARSNGRLRRHCRSDQGQRLVILWTDANLRVSTSHRVQILVISGVSGLRQFPAVLNILRRFLPIVRVSSASLLRPY